MTERPTLLFVSTRFLFPVDSGGKIRTTQILKGLKGGRFRIVLVSPATEKSVNQYRSDIDAICDEFEWWPEPRRTRAFSVTRMRFLASGLPIPVRTDRHRGARSLIGKQLSQKPDVAVFDFAHAGVLSPDRGLECPSVMFTHNVEAEIFHRHRDVASNPVFKVIWANQYRKMLKFERDTLRSFDVVVAVAERDAEFFRTKYGVANVAVIPTGGDLDFFSYDEPSRSKDVVFLGSMDWLANQEAVGFFMDKVWQGVVDRVPDARMTVVGRAPPEYLIKESRR